MSIALYDEDMIKYKQVPFNLELMKLATYYKKRREIVILSSLFNPERYSKFILRKDYYDGEFIPNLTNIPNIEYGGLAFTNNIYIPFDEEIESCIPDTYIYQRFKSQFVKSVRFDTNFKCLLKSEHLRLSLDGKNVWPLFDKQINKYTKQTIFFLHDYNLGSLNGATDAIDELISRIPETKLHTRVGAKFPIIINTDEALVKWGSYAALDNLYTIQFNGIASDEAIYELSRQAPTKVGIRQFEYNVAPPPYEADEKLKENLPKIFKQALFLQSQKQKFSLTYDDNFLKDKRWGRVIELINIYAHASFFSSRVTLFNFADHMREDLIFKTDVMTRNDAIEVFRFVKDNCYELFRMFYETSKVYFEGGEIKDAGIQH